VRRIIIDRSPLEIKQNSVPGVQNKLVVLENRCKLCSVGVECVNFVTFMLFTTGLIFIARVQMLHLRKIISLLLFLVLFFLQRNNF
jgi:hypothetical protein